MIVFKLKALYVIQSLCFMGCATTQIEQPNHQFNFYSNEKKDICMPVQDWEHLYKTYTEHYKINVD